MSTINSDRKILATLKERYPLTKDGSSKQTWHITLDIEGQPLDFEPGDSLGIHAQNDPRLVDHLILAMRAHPDDTILHTRSNTEMSLHTFLTHHANLARTTSSFLKLIHSCATCPQIEDLLNPENKAQLKEYLAQKDPLGLLRDYAKVTLPLQQLCDQFGPLLPRFYSIASSKRTSPHTVDLTVALFTWEQSGERRYGVASHFLCHLAKPTETPIPLYVQPARHFRLPEDLSANIIMIGPGTGIAPYRAFLQERLHLGATGQHWLFFGERNRDSDFFYEEEWKNIGPSLRLDTAFSRDQEHKVYVQHRMQENAAELYRWLDNGAYLYVCGDADVMAKDVEHTLHRILIDHGNMDETAAKAHLKALKKQGRYNLDVY